MTNVKTLSITHPRIEKAESIEDILCLSTLIANGELLPNANLDQSKEFYVNETGENCNKCPFKLTCLACIINE